MEDYQEALLFSQTVLNPTTRGFHNFRMTYHGHIFRANVADPR